MAAPHRTTGLKLRSKSRLLGPGDVPASLISCFWLYLREACCKPWEYHCSGHGSIPTGSEKEMESLVHFGRLVFGLKSILGYLN